MTRLLLVRPWALFPVLLAACLVQAGTGRGATITYSGSNLDLGKNWRTAATPKLDIDGNNVLGTDGWYVTGSAIGTAKLVSPRYVRPGTMWIVAPEYAGNGNYYAIDNPNTTPGASPTTVLTGTKNPFPGTNVESEVYRFTVTGSVPSVFRLGVMVDNLDAAGYNPNGMRLVQQGGPGDSTSIATTAASYNNRNPDWLYFDVSGAQAGDTFQVFSKGGPNGAATAGAFSFDNLTGPLRGVVVANARGDYRSASAGQTTAAFDGGKGIPDTTGAGHWNYYTSTTQNPTQGTLTLLSYGGVGNAGNSGFGGGSAPFNMPAVSDRVLFSDGGTVSFDELAWHPANGSPGPGNPTYTVLRWTAGPGEEGFATVDGTLRKPGPSGRDDFSIFIDGVNVFSATPSTGVTAFDGTSVTAVIHPGSTIDFVLGNFNGDYGGDEARLAATITVTIPEPSAIVMLLLGGVALAAQRRGRRRSDAG